MSTLNKFSWRYVFFSSPWSQLLVAKIYTCWILLETVRVFQSRSSMFRFPMWEICFPLSPALGTKDSLLYSSCTGRPVMGTTRASFVFPWWIKMMSTCCYVCLDKWLSLFFAHFIIGFSSFIYGNMNVSCLFWLWPFVKYMA